MLGKVWLVVKTLMKPHEVFHWMIEIAKTVFFKLLSIPVTFLRAQMIRYAQRPVVGIFSYSDPEDYSWISQRLRSPEFNNLIKEVKPVCISTNNNTSFTDEARKCDFAILYHTHNRGRLNITNVTDSLYDQEIRYLSESKGRSKVIVVIDDVQRNDNEEKLRILHHQPDIGKYARDLLLFNREDKMRVQKIDQNLQQIRDLMTTDNWGFAHFCNYLSSMTSWVCSQVPCRGHRGDLYEPLLV